MSITATRRFQFCAGHRVHNHESKCRNLHGHNYVVLVTASGELDELGRIIDFGELKRMALWCEENWDHGFILKRDDNEARTAIALMSEQKKYLMTENPTAENMAGYLLRDVAPVLFAGTGVTITKVTVWETENCFAEASL